MSSSLSWRRGESRSLTPESKVVAVGQTFVVLVVVFPLAETKVIGAPLAQAELVATRIPLVLCKRGSSGKLQAITAHSVLTRRISDQVVINYVDVVFVVH